MKFPCELVVWKLLPAIRAKLALELKKSGLPQKKIADILNVTEAAVSQYLSKKRASEFKIDQKLDKDFGKAADRIQKDSDVFTIMKEACGLCKEIRKGKFMCDLHRENAKLPLQCNICMGDKK